MADRRARTARVRTPELPRRARRYADQLRFFQRLEPADLQLEDIDSDRLVVAFQQGDQTAALTLLYERYFPRVYWYALKVLANSSAAEDVTQEVFLRISEALPKYEIRPGNRFRRWLFRITRNVTIDAVRYTTRVEPRVVPEALRETAPSAATEYLRTLGWLGDSRIANAVEALPGSQGRTLFLRYSLDLSVPEVAAVIGKSPQAVRNLEHRGLGALRIQFQKLGLTAEDVLVREPMRVRLRHLPVVRERRFALASSTISTRVGAAPRCGYPRPLG